MLEVLSDVLVGMFMAFLTILLVILSVTLIGIFTWIILSIT